MKKIFAESWIPARFVLLAEIIIKINKMLKD